MIQSPFSITTSGGISRFLVTEAGKGLCSRLIMAGANAKTKVVIRLAGGCGNLEPEKRAGLIDLMVADFDGFSGVLFTGATREVTEGKLNPMITDIPGFVAQRNSGCISLGTVPKTWADYVLKDESRLAFSENDDSLVPAPGLHRFLIIQEGCEVEANWDADLPGYFEHIEAWAASGFKPALVSYNGGGVTEKEIVGAAERGWTLFLYEGSGRKTEEFIQKWSSDSEFRAQYPDAQVHIVVQQSGALRGALIKNGFIVE